MDGTFFSEEIIELLDECDVMYTISVPLEQYTTIKCYIDDCRRCGLWTGLRASTSTTCR